MAGATDPIIQQLRPQVATLARTDCAWALVQISLNEWRLSEPIVSSSALHGRISPKGSTKNTSSATPHGRRRSRPRT